MNVYEDRNTAAERRRAIELWTKDFGTDDQPDIEVMIEYYRNEEERDM